MDAEKITKTINTAIGCVMASGMTIKGKQEVIEALREIEEKLNNELFECYEDDDCDKCDDLEDYIGAS